MEVERYPISVRLVGVMHKEKIKMYLTSVLWSDQNDILVYRSLQDFKKMHKQMKNAFPPASKLKKSDRIIPTFQDKKIKPIGRKKGPTKSLVRLKNLQKYCNELLSCDPRVSQSADLIRFFHPSDQDMQPEFAKNSIMVMPSENEIRNDGGNVTQPFVTETYRCVAPYETKDTKNKPFKVAVDENVDVLIKDKAGWWLVEKENKQMAWFPAPYLEKIDDDDGDDDEDEIDSIPERGMLYSAVKTYKATKDDEINVNIGAVVEVLQKSDNGWWLIRYKGEVGYIPTMYLQPHNYPHIHLTPHHQDRRVSAPLISPPSNLVQQSKFSRSQGNLLAAAPARSFSPNPPAARTTFSAAPVVTTSPAAKHAPPPTIMVEMDGEEEPRAGSPPEDSEGSFGSDSSDVSFSDDLSSSSASSFLDLSRGANDEQLRLSRTPLPMASTHLSPTSLLEGKLIHSVSDPNLFKMPAAPRVPPRPQTQDILSRCTTITRKNAAREQRPSR